MSWWGGSYEDVFADNPCFKEIIERNNGLKGLDSHWNDSGTIDVWEIRKLTDFIKIFTRVSTKRLDDDIERNRTEILSGFRFAKCRMGYKDDCSGEEMYACCSSRWGVFSEFSTFNQDEDDWESDGFHAEKPDWETAGFVGVRPEDLSKRSELSKTMKLILDHLSNEPVDLSRKNMVFIGSYDQYFYDVLQKNSGYSYSDEPWTSREESFSLGGNYSEIDMMDWWLSKYRTTVYPLMTEGISNKFDYVVIRLDKWAEGCINIQDIQKAIAEKIPIISEYQLWKALFYKEELWKAILETPAMTEQELQALEEERKQRELFAEQEKFAEKQRKEEEKRARQEERMAARKVAEERKQQRAAERAEAAEIRRRAEQEKLAKKEEIRKAKEAERQEAQRIADEARAEKQAALEEARANAAVLYAPGEEPEPLHTRIQNLLAKLDEAYPDHVVVNLNKEHKKWGETITDLYRKLGYADNKSFLEAYGFKSNDDKGGRPSTLNPEAVIAELKKRYPGGTDLKVGELIAENKDLSIKTLQNKANELLGMSLAKYLKEQGITK